jgi:hypothetical protein
MLQNMLIGILYTEEKYECNQEKNGAGGVAQVEACLHINPEFKPQYCKKRKERKCGKE